MFTIDLLKVPYLKLLAVIAFCFSSVIAPYWFLCKHEPEFFKNTEIIKLLLTCVSIGFPLTACNVILIVRRDQLKEKDEVKLGLMSMLWGSLVASSVLYGPFFYTGFFPKYFTQKSIVPILIAYEVLFILHCEATIYFQKRTIAKKEKEQYSA